MTKSNAMGTYMVGTNLSALSNYASEMQTRKSNFILLSSCMNRGHDSRGAIEFLVNCSE